MNEDLSGLPETSLRNITRDFPYPPTPDIAASVMRRLPTSRPVRAQRGLDKSRRLAWGLAVLLVVLAVLLLVPPVRASILEFLQIGAVRIFLNAGPVETTAPSPVPTITPTSPARQSSSNTIETLAPSPAPTESERLPADRVTLFDLWGETSLEDARRQVDFPVDLPTYPADLGSPDRVFLSDVGDDVLVLAWLEPGQTDRVYMSLHLIGPEAFPLLKWQPRDVEETEVNGRRAVWTTGPYPLVIQDEYVQHRRLIDGHVLVWMQGEITYRLETDLPLEEAVRVAESIPVENRDR